MKEFWNIIQLIFAAIGGWLGYFLGGKDGLLYALIVFVVVDYITGVMCAIANKTLSNEGLSLLENAAYLGLPIPQKLKEVLEQLHERSEKEPLPDVAHDSYTADHEVNHDEQH